MVVPGARPDQAARCHLGFLEAGAQLRLQAGTARPQGLLGGMELTPSGIRKILAERRARAALAAAAKAEEQGGEA